MAGVDALVAYPRRSTAAATPHRLCSAVLPSVVAEGDVLGGGSGAAGAEHHGAASHGSEGWGLKWGRISVPRRCSDLARTIS
jgi:hypothetical protein